MSRRLFWVGKLSFSIWIINKAMFVNQVALSFPSIRISSIDEYNVEYRAENISIFIFTYANCLRLWSLIRAWLVAIWTSSRIDWCTYLSMKRFTSSHSTYSHSIDISHIDRFCPRQDFSSIASLVLIEKNLGLSCLSHTDIMSAVPRPAEKLLKLICVADQFLSWTILFKRNHWKSHIRLCVPIVEKLALFVQIDICL